MPRKAASSAPHEPSMPPPIPEESSSFPEREEVPADRTNRRPLTETEWETLPLKDLMARMTEKDWADCMLYLYRLFPAAINRNTGEHSNIGKFQHSLSPEEIKASFGGGKFKLQLNRRDKTVSWERINLPGDPIWTKEEEPMGKPEIPQAAPVGSDAKNAKELIELFLTKLAEREQSAGNLDAAAALQKSVELVSKGAEKSIEIMSAQMNRNPNDIATMFKTFQELQGGSNPFKSVGDIVAMIGSIMKLAPTGTPADPIEQFTKMAGVLKSLREETGEGAGPVRSDWRAELARAGIELMRNLPRTLAEWRAMHIADTERMAAAVSRRLIAAPPGRAVAPPQPTTVTPVAAPSADNLSETATAIPAPTVLSAEGAAPQVQGSLTPTLLRMYAEGDPGEFVGRFVQLQHPNIYAMLSRQSVEEIEAYLKSYPVFDTMTSDAGFHDWIVEIVNFFSEQNSKQREPASVPEEVSAPASA